MLGMNVSTYSEPALNRKFLFLFEAMCEPKLSSASIDFHFAYSYKQKHKLDYNLIFFNFTVSTHPNHFYDSREKGVLEFFQMLV